MKKTIMKKEKMNISDTGTNTKRKAQRDSKKNSRRRIPPRLTELLMMTGVIAAALFMPQVLFSVQDRIQWGKMELSRREGMDLEALHAAYEKSLYQRMANYAKGLAAGNSFYVASKTLTADQDLVNYLYSEKGLYQNIMDFLLYVNVIPMIFLENDCEVKQWKQYVIYSDHDTEGVNFILWYIELSSLDGIRLKLLADAESGTLYALKLENCQWVDYGYDSYDSDYRLSREDMIELWSICGLYFEAFRSGDEVFYYIQEESDSILFDVQVEEMAERIYANDEGESFDLKISEENMEEYILSRIQVVREDGEDRISFQLPYENCSLEILMKSSDRQIDVPDSIPGTIYMFPDTVIGVRQIYEMIPEFAGE